MEGRVTWRPKVLRPATQGSRYRETQYRRARFLSSKIGRSERGLLAVLAIVAGVVVDCQPARSEFAACGAQGEGLAEVFRYRVFQ